MRIRRKKYFVHSYMMVQVGIELYAKDEEDAKIIASEMPAEEWTTRKKAESNETPDCQRMQAKISNGHWDMSYQDWNRLD